MKIIDILQENYIVETGAPEINVAYKLLNNMPYDAQGAIRSFEYSMWATGELENAYQTKNEIYDTIETYANKLRKIIQKQHGNTITLYRGLYTTNQNNYKHTNRKLYSWTMRKEVAAVFAGLGYYERGLFKLNKNKKVKDEFLIYITDQEATQIQDTFTKNKKAKYKNMFFILHPMDNEFVSIYIKTNDRYRSFGSTQTNKLKNYLIKSREEIKKFKEEINLKGQNEGYVVKDEIPIDNIVWVLNNGKPPFNGTIEYIVKNNSGINSEKINF